MVAVIVELATLADYEAVCAIDRQAGSGCDRQAALRDWIVRGECRVARAANGAVDGFVVASCSFFGHYFIVLLVVHSERRRRGFASALIRAVEACSPTAKLFTSTNQSNVAMQALCESLGFERSGVVENLDEGDPELIYFKRAR